MPESVGRCLRKAVNASRPPADAPTPTIGNKFPLVSGLLIGGGGRPPGRFFWHVGVPLLVTQPWRASQNVSIAAGSFLPCCFLYRDRQAERGKADPPFALRARLHPFRRRFRYDR